MKNFLLLFLSLIIASDFTSAQDAESIIKQSQLKADEVNTCSYLIYKKTKLSGMKDTLYQTGRCTLAKVEQDTILRKHIYTDNFTGIKEIYNGDFYFKSRRTDSTAYIWDARRFNFFVHQFATNSMVYSPLVNKVNIYSQLLNDTESTLALAVDTIVSESLCYHIKTFTKKLKDSKETGITISADLFIRKSDFIPMGHIQNLQSNIAGAVTNYEQVFIEDLEINKDIDENIFSLSNVPSNYTLKQEGVVNIKNYIVADEMIPDLDFNYIKSDTLYETIKGRNVLIAFNASGNCVPCKLATDMILNINQKYKTRNLSVILVTQVGTNDYSNQAANIDTKTSLPSLSHGQDIIDKNRITVFPTVYLFNKHGEQVYKNEGFSNRMQEEIEKEIDALPLN